MIFIEILKISLAYLIPTLVGLVFISVLEKGKAGLKGVEKLALSFALGSGFVSSYMFYLGVLGIRFNFWTASAIVWPFLICGIFILGKRGPKSLICFSRPLIFSGKTKWKMLLTVLLFALLLWKTSFISFEILACPTYFDDSVANHNYKAKVFYHNQSLVLDKDHPDFLGGYMPWKAPGTSLFKTWVAIWVGTWKEYAVNLNSLFVFLALGLISYYSLARILPPLASLAFTYMILSIPLLTFHAAFAYVDIVAGWYFFSGIVYLIRWIREKDRTAFFLSALLFGVGLSTKNEMIALFVGGALPVLILYQLITRAKFREMLQTTACYLGLVIIFNVPWFVIKGVYNLALGIPEEYRQLEFHPEGFNILASYLFDSGNYNILWPVFFCTLIFSSLLVAKTELKYLLISLAGALAVTLSLFIFTSFFEYLRSGMTINRALLTILPVIVFYIAAFYGKLTEEKELHINEEQ